MDEIAPTSSRTSIQQVRAPSISMPKGGGAIRGIGEKFSANPVTGTGGIMIPIAMSSGRGGLNPQITLSYDSGNGNGPFGLGWSLNGPAISRKTEKGLPQYNDGGESDVFILAGAEDLVPVLDRTSTGWEPAAQDEYNVASNSYWVRRYRPRSEGTFALIERWTNNADPADSFWRTISSDNATVWFGRTAESRIADPADKSRIFQWLICESHDDRGNAVTYSYLSEDSRGVDSFATNEINRPPAQRTANRYLHRIRYGNTEPYYPTLAATGVWPSPDSVGNSWMFEVVFDYGQCDPNAPTPGDNNLWPSRPDPFSTYRAAFELRTYRLCRRALMFHHFTTELQIADYLVRSTEFMYEQPSAIDDPQMAGYSTLTEVRQLSYERKAAPDTDYDWRESPPVDFTYSKPKVDTAARLIDATQLENLPIGTQGPGFRWIDLNGEGLAGILSEQGPDWYYKSNLGNGCFGAMTAIARPAMAALADGRQQLMDLAGDGAIELVEFSGLAPGLQERNEADGWHSFIPFSSLPVADWNDGNLRFIDLTGDGLADILITEDNVFTWYPSLEEHGFSESRATVPSFDEEQGPHLVFVDGTETIFLADMSGDGLTDLVRIRNSEVCYWPNLGYGRFGSKITLRNSPVFDHPDLYNPERIRLADVDGSGPVDVIYLGRSDAAIYFNRSGNSLSDPLAIPFPIASENLNSVQVADLLGNGTACLVWNSHLPADQEHPVQYIDLMGGRKPHLLTAIANNIGATTTIEYRPSTAFYIEDRLSGTPWITRLPFPVQCVSKVTVADQWRGTQFSSSYSYHHGYFDGIEREFRGFGRVEQVDVESYGAFVSANTGSPYITDDQKLYQPPVKTISWFHTGVASERTLVQSRFAAEYFPAKYPLPATFHEKAATEPATEDSLTAVEWREAMRAVKGMPLRQEVYELDVKALEAGQHTAVRLFSTATRDYRIHLVQPRANNRHAVFLVIENEALTYQYELDLRESTLSPDPRIDHTLTLRSDDQGNLQQSISVGYGRWIPWANSTLPAETRIRDVQAEVHMAYTEIRYTTDVELNTAGNNTPLRHRRLRLPCEVKTYEITGVSPSATRYFEIAELQKYAFCEDGTYPPVVPAGEQAITLTDLKYHEQAQASDPARRIVDRARTLYFKDEDGIAQPDEPHDFGQHGPRGMKYEDYKLSLTGDLLDRIFSISAPDASGENRLDWLIEPGATARDKLADSATSGYVAGTAIDPALTNQYWMRSGIAGFNMDAANDYYLPQRYTDPFGNLTIVEYHQPDFLYIESITDAAGNRTSIAQFDYRVLAPRETVDISGNHTEVAFDIPGRVTALAVKGKFNGTDWEGDDLTALDFSSRNLAPADIQTFCTSNSLDDLQARAWLGRATSRFVYHFGEKRDTATGQVLAWAQTPPGACGIQRENHFHSPDGATSPLQVGLEFSDGSGTRLMTKLQAEPAAGESSLRWIVNGLTILNNKGKAVKQYEPTFTSDFGFEMPQANNVTTVMYYDAPGRLVRSEFPDGTFGRIEYSPWLVCAFDQNDTVEQSDWYGARNSTFAASVEEKRAAALALVHKDTPLRKFLDSRGRQVITITHNRINDSAGTVSIGGQTYRDDYTFVHMKLDAEGKPLWVRDGLGKLAMQFIAPAKSHVDPDDDIPAASVPCYDIAGNLLYQHSMDAGDRWLLADAAGKPMLAWDYNQYLSASGLVDERRLFFMEYDALRRRVATWLSCAGRPAGTSDAFTSTVKAKLERYEYQDSLTPDASNLNGQPVRQYDSSGIVEIVRRDFEGNVLQLQRTLASDAQSSRIDWQNEVRSDGSSDLGSETYTQITEYDALKRPIRLYNWHLGNGSRVTVFEPQYNERGALTSQVVSVRATKTASSYSTTAETRLGGIDEVRYDAKGQRTLLRLANETITRYDYDADNFRLRQLRTTRPSYDPTFPDYHSNLTDGKVIQQLSYVYDPVGNVSEIVDEAYKPAFFDNGVALPGGAYQYDALYRLIAATGRESAQGGNAAINNTEPIPGNGFPVTDQTLRSYTETYEYDAAGNLLTTAHQIPGDTVNSWTRRSTIQPDSNRLWQNWYGAAEWDQASLDQRIAYRYDTHGNMLNLNRSPQEFDLSWDHRNMIATMNLGGGGQAYYQYDAGKHRTRKRIYNQTGTGYWERIYLGGYERYRRYDGSSPQPIEEIESHHLSDGTQRVLLVDDVLTPKTNQTLFRYQYSNYLGSGCVELDDQAAIISYEEFHPYGTSAYRAATGGVETPAKRYRYAGIERDDESGLNYHQARYYDPHIARWTSCDELVSLNRYVYAESSPIGNIDADGRKASTVFWGGVQAVGGLLQMAGGVALAINVEVPVAAQAGGLALGLHGFDDFKTGLKKAMTGEESENDTVAAVRSVARGFGAEEKKATAIAQSVDLILSLISPAGPEASGPKLAPLLETAGARMTIPVVAEAKTASGLPNIMMMANASGKSGQSGSSSSSGSSPSPAPSEQERLARRLATETETTNNFVASLSSKIPQNAAQDVANTLKQAATKGGLKSADDVTKRVIELMELSESLASKQGLANVVPSSTNRALGNRAHMLLKYALEMLDLELRMGKVGGEQLGVASEMFVKFKSGEFVFLQRVANSKGLDAVLFAEGEILKGLDLKTGRLLTATELQPYLEAFKEFGLKLQQIVQVGVKSGQPTVVK